MSDWDEPLSGPQELVSRLVEGRESGRHNHPENYGSVSEESLRRLVMLSYFTSQSAEEGHYPRFRLYIPPPSSILPAGLSDPWQLLRFASPVSLVEVDDLRRLAPCAASHDFALEIAEQGDDQGKTSVSCIGVRMAHSGEGGAEILSSSLWARQLRPGLMIRVDGPGELRASEAGRAWDLRAGRLIDLGGLPIHPLQGRFDELSKKLAASQGRNESHISHTLHFAWNELIHASSEQGRGGCFVILPDSGTTQSDVQSKFDIHMKYPTLGLMFGKEVAELVSISRTNTARYDLPQFRKLVADWFIKKSTLLRHIECLTRLSGVDGCTVFDSNLQLLGFGGKIAVQDQETNRRFKDARTHKWLSMEIMKKTGTRHLSAFKLCNAREGVSCYVVSQDGHVTLFWSDSDTVYRWAPYWPWAKRSDHF